MNFKNTISLLILIFSTSIFSQTKINILDSETKQPIPQARVVYNNEISYTNDDGFVLLPNDTKTINIFIPRYEQGSFEVKNIIELKPIYNEIEEVVLRPVDAKKIIATVLKNYDKNYETKTSIYNGTYKRKSEIDDNLNRILILDMDLWALNNKYDYRKNVDDFMQINLRNKKFDKNKRNDKTYIFNKKEDISSNENNLKAILQRYFLYNELVVLEYLTKNLKINGNIINEEGDLQTINFKSAETSNNEVTTFDGVMYFNKKENAISYLKVNHYQKNATSKYLTNFDKEATVLTNLFTVTYDMFKKTEKYIPAKITMNYEAYITLEDKTYPTIVLEEFIFSKHNFANKNGLSSKIDLSKNFLDNIKDDSIKDSKTLLSSEEQKFVDE